MTVTVIAGASDAAVVTTADATFVSAPAPKLISFTRLMTLAAGSQSVTGVGFQPRLITFQSNVTGTFSFAIGTATPTAQASFTNWTGGVWVPNAYVGVGALDGTNYQTFVVTTFDVDGFTITWTKTGSPTGTCSIFAECFR